jgi:hypothetical protein
MRSTVLAGVMLAVVALAATAPAQAEIRFYYINSQGQQTNVFLVMNTNKEGCHAFPVARDINRVAILDFKYCTLYRSRSCKAGTEIPARWKNKAKKEATKLTQGSRWILKENGHVEVSAWRCVK